MSPSFQDNEKYYDKKIERQGDIPPDNQAVLHAFHAGWELNGKKSYEEDQQDRKTVKQAIDDEGRKNRTLADIFLFTQNKSPDEFAQPGGQYVIRHVTDYGCGKEVAEPSLFKRQQEKPPTHRPEKIADKGEEHSRPEITVIHLSESGEEFVKIYLPEQQENKEKANPDPDPELFVAEPLRHINPFPGTHDIQ